MLNLKSLEDKLDLALSEETNSNLTKWLNKKRKNLIKLKSMNKIERAIYDTKLHIEKLERERLILIAELNVFKNQLDMLESIESNKSIPHIEIPKNEKENVSDSKDKKEKIPDF